MNWVLGALVLFFLLCIWVVAGCLVLTVVDKHDRLHALFLKSGLADKVAVLVFWPSFALMIYEHDWKNDS